MKQIEKLKYRKLNTSIQEFINGLSEELKNIPTHYYNRNNIYAVLEYLGLEGNYIVRDNCIYVLELRELTDSVEIVNCNGNIEIIRCLC